jgi:hypothetical protein
MKNATVVMMLVVCLAMAAPAFGSVDIDTTWTVDAAWGLDYTSDARFGSSGGASGTVNIVSGGTWNTDGEMRFAENGIAATINVEVGGILNAEVEMQWNEGEVGAQTNRLNVYGTAYVEQLKMYGFAGDDTTTVGNGTDAATLNIVEGLLGKDGDASIIINAGSNMNVAGGWDGAFHAEGTGYIDLVGTGTLTVNALNTDVATSLEPQLKGDGTLGNWVMTFDAAGFNGDGANIYTAAAPDTGAIVSIAGGDWNALTSWDTGAVPTDVSDVTISHIITLQPPAAAAGVAYTLAIDGTGTLNVNNELTIADEITIAATGALNIGATGIVNAGAASTANMTLTPGASLDVDDLTIASLINLDDVNVAIASNNITIASNGELSMGAVAAPYVSTGDLNVQGTLTNVTDITVRNITMAVPYAIESGHTLSAASGTLAAINTAGIATIDARDPSGEITATNLSIANGGTLVKDGAGKLSFSGTSTIGTGVVVEVNAGHIALASAPTGLDTIQLNGATFETSGVVTGGFAPGLLGAHLDGDNFDGVNDGNLGMVMGPLGGRSNGEHWDDVTENHTSQLVYEGQIYLDGGPTTFVESIDDGTRLIIDGETVLDNGGWNDTTHGTIDRTAGWYDVEIRFRNGNGGYGPGGWDGWDYNLTGFGFGMDINGNDNEEEANFVFPLDPGTGSGTLFRVPAFSTGEIVMDTTDVVVTADSSLIANTDSTATFGSLNFNAPATLTTSGADGAIIFADTTVADGVNGFNTESNTQTGELLVGAANATIVKTGAADLILDPSAPTIGAGSLAFDVKAGRLIAQLSGANPLGVDSAIGINGGEVVLSGSAPATFDNPITSTGGTLTVGAPVTLGNATTNNVTLTSGTLLVQATDADTLNIAGNITGGGNMTIGANTPVITQGTINAGVVTINGSLETNGAVNVSDLQVIGGSLETKGAANNVSDLQVIGGQLDLTGGNMTATTVTARDGGIDASTNALVVSSAATLGVVEISASDPAKPFELSGANLTVDTARTITLTGGTVTLESGYDASAPSAPSSAPSAAPTAGVIFSVDHNNLPAVDASVATWDGFSQKGGDPTVVEMGGEKWMENLRDTSDRLRHDSGGHGTTPISINGATIVTAIKPTRHASGNPWTSIVDIFYDQLCIGVLNETGQIKVKISGANGANPIWTSAADKVLPEEPGVLSLSVDNTGDFEVFWRGVNDGAAVSMGTGSGNLAGAAYNALYPSANGRGYAQYINLGGNDPDPWPTYNGLIGDTYVYDNQLSPTELTALQDEVYTAMGLAPGAINLPGTTVVATETSTLLLANIPGAVTFGGMEVAASKTLTIDSPSTDIQLTNLNIGGGSLVRSTQAASVSSIDIAVSGKLTIEGDGQSYLGDLAGDGDDNSTNLTLGDGAVIDWVFGSVGADNDSYLTIKGLTTLGASLTVNIVDGGGSADSDDVYLLRSLGGVVNPTAALLGDKPEGWTGTLEWVQKGPSLWDLQLTGLTTSGQNAGDTNGDGFVDDTDMANFELAFGLAGAELIAKEFAFDPDFDDDGDADLDDFVSLRESFGNNYNLAPSMPDLSQTPEPATMSLMALGALALLRRRRNRA